MEKDYNGLEENIESLEGEKLEDMCGTEERNTENIVIEPVFRPDLISLRSRDEPVKIEAELDENIIETKFIRLMRRNNIAG